MGPGGSRGWHLQARQRAPRPLRIEGRDSRQGRDRLLPDRRTLLLHLVRPALPARLSQRPELRRILDRVGEPDRRPNRKVGLAPRNPPPSKGEGRGGVRPSRPNDSRNSFATWRYLQTGVTLWPSARASGRLT